MFFFKVLIEAESDNESGKAAVVLHGHLDWSGPCPLTGDYPQRHEDTKCIGASAGRRGSLSWSISDCQALRLWPLSHDEW